MNIEAIRHSLIKRRLLILVGAALLLLAGIWIYLEARVWVRRFETSKRLTMIFLALDNYYQANGSYPPQYIVDDNGKPAHSWRVLLLPYLEEKQLYQRYRFDEPWNGPHNRILATEMPEVYRSPFQDSKSTITQYVGIAGKDTPWQGKTPLRKVDTQRGFPNPLIWFVEVANSDINWMEPRDIQFEQALVGINITRGRGIQSNYSYGLPAQLMPSGCVWVPTNISSDAFRAMLTIAQGEGNGKKE
jgi:hypothetical protein